MKIMKNIKDSFKLFRFNIRRIVAFELVLQVISAALLIPFCYAFLNLTIRASGVTYLSRENVAQFVRMPTTWIGVFIFAVILSFFLLINVSGLSICYDWANHTKKIGLIRMLILAVRHSVRVFIPHNMPMPLFVLCYLPVTGATIVGLTLLNIKFPRYLSDAIVINKWVAIGLVLGYIILNLCFFTYVFAIHVFIIRKVPFVGAMRIARRILYKKKLRVLPGLFAVTVAILGMSWLMHFLLTGPLLHWMLQFKRLALAAGFVFESLNVVLYLLYVMLFTPLLHAFICNSFYNNVPDPSREQKIEDYVDINAALKLKRGIYIIIAVVLLAIAVDVAFYVLIKTDTLVLKADHINSVTITAHRGASKKAPENSLSAFEIAIADGADVVELDVRQTKDGVVVVMHDENIKRVTGANKKIGDLTYEELLQYNLDADHGDEFPDEKIPTLREAIELIDGRVDMNIELKPAKTDINLEECVAELVAEYDLYDSCVVTSQTYDSIRKIKQYDEKIKTVYVMSVAMGQFFDLEYADAFSIKYIYVNGEVVKRVHDAGKDIYVWTIDDERNLERMMLLNVDSIITNRPDRLKKGMVKNMYGDTLFEYLNMYLESQY